MRSPLPPRNASAALDLLHRRLFDAIRVPEAWVHEVRQLAQQGTVVYLLRNRSAVDLLALDHLTRQHGLPAIGFANDLHLGPLDPMGRGLLDLLRRRDDGAALRDVLLSGHSAALFLKRPPTALDLVSGATGGRGLRQGDQLLQTLLEVQKASDRPVFLVPQVFVWTRRPDTLGTQFADALFGPREWPSELRTLAQFVTNHRHVEMKAGTALDLRAFLASQAETSDEVLVRRIVYSMLRRLERERRAVTGPALTPPDRIRAKVLRSPKLQKVVARMAGDKPEDRLALTRKATEILQSMQALPDLGTSQAVGLLLDRLFHRVYAGVDVDQAGLDAVRECSKGHTLVLLPCHKSHLDSLIVSYVFERNHLGLPLIAAGDNLAFFPIGPVARRAGAFFIRRSFAGDKLYAATAEAYLRRLLRDGHTLELFLEGGRSRTGKLLKPQVGLLNIIVEAALTMAHKPVAFVPISIGYERIIEAQSYERELTGGDKQPEDAAGLLRSTELLRHRYGRINVQFGRPMALPALREELGVGAGSVTPAKRRALVNRIANRTMDEINRVTAVTPGALTALALMSDHRRSVTEYALLERCDRLFEVLLGSGVRMTPACLATGEPDRLNHRAIRQALQMFRDGNLVEQYRTSTGAPDDSEADPPLHEAAYRVPEDRRLQLDTVKNHIVHFFVERAIGGTVVLAQTGPIPVDQARERCLQLAALLKHEMRFRAGRAGEEVFAEMLDTLVRCGDLREQNGLVGPGPGSHGWSGEAWLRTYRAMLRNFLEGYRIAARTLRQLVKAPMTEKDLLKRAIAVGNRMYLNDELRLRESVNRALFENALLAFRDEGYLAVQKGRYALTESFASETAVRAIEGRIADYLG